MDASVILLLLVGVVVGFYLGRWTTEFRRGRFDSSTAWNARRRYRGK